MTLRYCNGTDKKLIGEDGKPCKCGSRFKDTDHLLVYPHLPLRGHGGTKSAVEYMEDKKKAKKAKNAEVITDPSS